MKEKLHIELTVPKDWTAKQAKTVWEFLESLMDAIWQVHGDDIDELIDKEEHYLLAAARGELSEEATDDFPF
jgi:ABC-type uncharacterized transport system YnjBCD substrate-binding protein